MSLYPIRLEPQFVERIWGTRDLSPVFGQAPGTELIGEVWLTGDHCKVVNGPLAGTPLGELARRFGRDLVGQASPHPDRFPLLLKFLFPQEKLSVQVHPDDEGAKRVGEPCGKTECWYVLHAKPGAKIGLGLKPGVTKSEFERAIREVRAEELLNWIEVRPGELYYVEAGTVHAIAPGSVLIETQQNSDTTYRLYDYGRPRELHIEKGIAAMKETTRAGKAVPAADVLIVSSCFQVEHHSLRGERGAESLNKVQDGRRSSVDIFVAVRGCGVFEGRGFEPVMFNAGDAVVVPASVADFSLRPQWELEFLRMYIPPVVASHLSSIVRPEHMLKVIRD
jgi:mannose-6-phosphate isomerase